jgi:hypothetical protein
MGAIGKSKIIRTIIKGDREHQLHATKGWRIFKSISNYSTKRIT